MKKRFIIAPAGGLADWLLCTPAFKALKENYPDHKIIVYVTKPLYKPICEVLKNNPSVDSVRQKHWRAMLRYPYDLYLYLFKFNKAIEYEVKHIKLKNVSFHKLHFLHVPPSFIYEKSIKEIVPEIFGLHIKEGRVQLFFSKEEDAKAKEMLAPYKHPVLMHTFSRSSLNQRWSIANWKALVKALPQYTFIQIGNPAEPLIEGVLDWRSKLSIREALCLVKHATAFVGVNSAYSHATNAFNTPGVVLFGDTKPVYWGHPNNINIYKQVACSPCLDHLKGEACIYKQECMEAISVEEVKQALIRQVSARNGRLQAGINFNNLEAQPVNEKAAAQL
jgi:ADP-heptose:LPS heptosyltransferase